MNLKTLIGNEKIKNTLANNVKNNSISHSYLFSGKEGIGKEKFAEEFARMILCVSKEKEDCNNCGSCIKFISGNHPDFVKVESDGNSIKISQIRQMQEMVYQKPIMSDKKIFIINDADLMTQEAQNSLLKTLEEPPEYIVIILIVANENMLLNTIKSRCVRLNFSEIQRTEIITYIHQNELIKKPTDNLIDMCGGSIGRAQSIKENINDYLAIENLLNNILNKSFKTIIDVNNNAEVLYKSKDNIVNLLEYMIVIIYNLLKKENIQISSKNKEYFDIIKIIENTKVKLNSNSNYDMCIDELLFKISRSVGIV